MNIRVNPGFSTKVLLFVIAVALWGLLLNPNMMGVASDKNAWGETSQELLRQIAQGAKQETEKSKQAQERSWYSNILSTGEETSAQKQLKVLEERYGLSGVNLSNFLLHRILMDID